VIYKHNKIKTKDDLILIRPYIMDKLSSISHVLPSYTGRGVANTKYSYNSVETAQKATDALMNDYINGLDVKLGDILQYIKRLYIVSSLANNKDEFDNELNELYQMAMYIKINGENENEMEHL
tara:strand:+ start:498 stop:866 length:369 start_codon:yes stop_codon:yes gene_type:complete